MSETGKAFGFDQDITNSWIEDNAGGGGSKALESGIYDFRIIQMERKTSNGAKYKGNPMAQLVFEHESCTIYEWIILNTDYKQKIANFLKAVYGGENPPAGFWDKLIGQEVTLEVEKFVDSFTNSEGKTIEFYKNKIVKMLPKGGSYIMGANGKTPANEPKRELPSGETVTKSELEGNNHDLPF